MIDLSTFYKNHFDTDKISDDNLNKFSLDHIQRMAAANTDGRFTDMITATTTAHNAYFGSISDEDINYAVQQSLTMSMKNTFENFQKTISQKEGIVRGNWNTDSPQYQEFFPRGLSEFSNASLANVETLMTRIVNAANNHIDVLGQPFVDIFTTIKNNFTASREAQLEKMGKVSDIKKSTGETRDVLEKQLMKNLLTLAIEYMDNPDNGMQFFNQQIIR